jgi:hypothetical protein
MEATARIYHGQLDPNTRVNGNIGDEYNQIVGGVFTKKWIKVSGNGTNTGWV